MTNTNNQYDIIIKECEGVFLKKTKDYGTAWRVLREISIVDQVYIKAQRIRNIQETGEQKVGNIGDDIRSEFIGIINYSIIGLIQLELTENDPEELDVKQAEALYHKYFIAAKTLMQSKNHDYGEAWRNMSQESFVDLILMKLQRMRQILSNKGETIISEGLDANFFDMINYAVFALILMGKESPVSSNIHELKNQDPITKNMSLLTPTELEILSLAAKNYTPEEIANELGTEVKAIEESRKMILGKLNLQESELYYFLKNIQITR